eukprot:gene10706-22347_t
MSDCDIAETEFSENWDDPIIRIKPTGHQDVMLKCVVIGDTCVGKTSLIKRFTESVFCESRITLGVEWAVQFLRWKGEIIKLQIWDTAGQERFRSMTGAYYRDADVIILVYDLSMKQSLCFDSSSLDTSNEQIPQTIDQWLTEIKRYARDDAPIIIVGNKIDRRTSNAPPCFDFNSLPHAVHMECSAYTGEGVEQVFLRAAMEAFTYHATNALQINIIDEAKPKSSRIIRLISYHSNGDRTPDNRPLWKQFKSLCY